MKDYTNRTGTFDVERAAQFFLAWQQQHLAPQQESHLIESRSTLAAWGCPVPATVDLAKVPQLDCKSLASFAEAFSNTYDNYRRSGAMVNVWRVAGLRRDELRNCQVLSWILDRFGDHGQGSAILERLVELAGKQMAGITAEKVRMNNYWTRIESQPLGDLESRVDIEIESAAFLIFIEVKVRAPETGDQLKRYADLAPKKAAGRPWSIIYLTTDGRKPNSGDLHRKVIPLSWNQVASILDTHTMGNLGNSFSNRIFEQFADHIRHLA
ncbi:MAG: PD-(D/E)XK nuclease family protein [Sulfuritalea sp.]|nr:PD-(D/E)XK nuclease family protein [Sulfuritalea sp.]MDP1984725.1 PD-(D/E)XK nuclease family protein [Sulfuritalea sp.]